MAPVEAATPNTDELATPKGAVAATGLPAQTEPPTGVEVLAKTTVNRPAARRPRPKKSLGATAAETAPAKKLTTLDKSRLDWNSHLHQAPTELKEEIEANRKGGGYLEKVDFLDRVGDRKEKMIEQEKANKKR